MQLVENATEAGESLAGKTDTHALAALEALQVSVDALFEAIDSKKKIAKEGTDAVAQKWEAMRTNIEEPVTKGTKEEACGKLNRVVMSYQDHEETVAEVKINNSAATAEVTAAKESLKMAIVDSKQLTLPGV